MYLIVIIFNFKSNPSLLYWLFKLTKIVLFIAIQSLFELNGMNYFDSLDIACASLIITMGVL